MTPEQRAARIQFPSGLMLSEDVEDAHKAIAAVIREAVNEVVRIEREACAQIADAQAAYAESAKAEGGWKWGEECDELKAECCRIAATIRSRQGGG